MCPAPIELGIRVACGVPIGDFQDFIHRCVNGNRRACNVRIFHVGDMQRISAVSDNPVVDLLVPAPALFVSGVLPAPFSGDGGIDTGRCQDEE